jgi:hypothetical protein
MSETRQINSGQAIVADLGGAKVGVKPGDTEPQGGRTHLWRSPHSKAPALAEQLMEEVCDRENLENAWKRVRETKAVLA